MTTKPLRLPRGRRAGFAAVVAIVIIALAVLGAIAAIQIEAHQDSTVLGEVHVISGWLRQHDWNSTTILTGGSVLAAVGLVLLLAAVLRPRRLLVRLADPSPDTVSGIARRGLPRDLGSAAASVDGITRAKVKVGRRRVKVTARTAMRDRTGLADAVRTAVEQRLAALAPARSMAVRARIVGKAS